MKIAIICFSKHGENTGKKIVNSLGDTNQVTLECKSKYTSTTINESIGEWTSHEFDESDALVFIGSCGIAVRAIAPFVSSKKTDPAVVVIDELGNFVIPILSGHLGGANVLANELANSIGATAVITTGTDVNGKLAPDVFAKRNNCKIDNMKAAEQVAAAIIHGESISLYTDMDVIGSVPNYIKCQDLSEYGEECGSGEVNSHSQEPHSILVSPFKKHRPEDNRTMWIIPKVYAIGIGCRRDTDKGLIKNALESAINEFGIDMRSIISLGSIDLKKDETGLLETAKEEKLNIEFFTESELLSVKGDFSKSQFVQGITGVDCVCERSAAKIAGEGYQMVMHKTVYDKVTIAVAMKKGIMRFE